MKRVHLIHWNAAEAAERKKRLRSAGYRVVGGLPTPAIYKELRRKPPDALVIDLSRLPSHGRDVGIALRSFASTRHVPLVYVEGEPAKVSAIRKKLPDATFTTWRRIRGSLKSAIASPPAEPVRTASVLAGYSGTPLPRKLGIKPGSVVGLVGAPRDFAETLGELPEGAKLRRSAAGAKDLLLWFTRSRRDLEGRIGKMAAAIGKDGLWICWPKQASGVKTDLREGDVRRTGLAAGLVDYKICAVDATWSGLRFARRKAKR